MNILAIFSHSVFAIYSFVIAIFILPLFMSSCYVVIPNETFTHKKKLENYREPIERKMITK